MNKQSTTACASDQVAYLRSALAIRQRCQALFTWTAAGHSQHFNLHFEKLPAVAELVLQVTRASYPTLAVPYHSRWRHFDAGEIPRVERFSQALAAADKENQARARFELAIISVLLDAGAGMGWSFKDPETGTAYSKSEGLAVASYAMFMAGLFSSDQHQRLQVDATGLSQIKEADLARGMQVTPTNPLVGLKGRLALLQRLGEQIGAAPIFFGRHAPRLGGLFDYLQAQAVNDTLPAKAILSAVLAALGPIWPGRIFVDGVNLGDVWPHRALNHLTPGPGLIPFHKLSQWLTYSLVEPLESAGIRINALDELTGLPEYRNGGLFIDMGVLSFKNPDAPRQTYKPDAELIIEWRALTVILLDEVAQLVRTSLSLDAESLPLAKVLQGGTWTAGRQVAKSLRPDGGPPLQLDSDGTVF